MAGGRRLALTVLLVLAAVGAIAAPAQALPPIKHVWVLVLENETYGTSFGPGSNAPYLARTLPTQGELLPNYYATGHQSLDNYITMVSGQAPNPDTQADCQFYTDFMPGTIGADGQANGVGCVYPSAVKTVADQLEGRGLSWRGYMEDMGTPCRHPALNSQDTTQTAKVGDQYAARHNPFVYFHSIIDHPTCQANDVPLERLTADLSSAATTPSYSFITPNLCHDGHDGPTCVNGEPGGLPGADQFLRRWVPRITSSPAYADGGLLVVTFDEASSSGSDGDSSACCNEPAGPNTPSPGGSKPGPGGGLVGAVLLSPYVRPGSVVRTPFNHYSLLRSVEDLFGLDHLGYAAQTGLSAFGADVFNQPGGSPSPVTPSGGGGSRRRSIPPRVAIKIAGIPRTCPRRRDFRLAIAVRAASLRDVRVRVDARSVRRVRTRRRRVFLRLSVRRGARRVTVTGSDIRGSISRSARLPACP